jgi:hypothetical protein
MVRLLLLLLLLLLLANACLPDWFAAPVACSAAFDEQLDGS